MVGSNWLWQLSSVVATGIGLLYALGSLEGKLVAS